MKGAESQFRIRVDGDKVTPLELWQAALAKYSYQVDLKLYQHREDWPGAFEWELEGGVGATRRFEDRFRERAEQHLDVWVEVVYWKMFSQKNRRDGLTKRIAKLWANEDPEVLLVACQGVLDADSDQLESAFEEWLNHFPFRKPYPIAVAATFPAFLDPQRFPMVDTRIAKWVIEHGEEFNLADPQAPQLVMPAAYATGTRNNLTVKDFDFVVSWIEWCRHVAAKLGPGWRARDVEMAVFTAWGNKHPFDSLRLAPP